MINNISINRLLISGILLWSDGWFTVVHIYGLLFSMKLLHWRVLVHWLVVSHHHLRLFICWTLHRVLLLWGLVNGTHLWNIIIHLILRIVRILIVILILLLRQVLFRITILIYHLHILRYFWSFLIILLRLYLLHLTGLVVLASRYLILLLIGVIFNLHRHLNENFKKWINLIKKNCKFKKMQSYL